RPSELPPPIETMNGQWSPAERGAVEERMRYALIGSAATIRARFKDILQETAADEIIATAQIFDHAARLRSFEIGAQVFREFCSPNE
ncbi:MAG: LLM class flavin-dependent oxidoreductase, partial [Chthoniobacterales bacterium]